MVKQISRRVHLKEAALIAAASTFGVAAFLGWHSTRAAVNHDDDDMPTMLNVAATAETFAVTHYYRVLTANTLVLSTSQKQYFAAAMYAELIHLQYLQSNGAQILASQFFFPVGTFASLNTFYAITSIVEVVFVGMYVAASHRIAELSNPALAATMAQIAVVEGQHLLAARQFAGEQLPNNIDLANPIFDNVSDSIPVIQPLLDGKKATSGPLAVEFETSAYQYPGDDKVTTLVKRSVSLSQFDQTTKPFTALAIRPSTPTPTRQPTSTPTRQPTSTPSQVCSGTTQQPTHLFVNPVESSNSVASVPPYIPVTLLGRQGNSTWLYAKVGNHRGWILAKYLKANCDLSILPVVNSNGTAQ